MPALSDLLSTLLEYTEQDLLNISAGHRIPLAYEEIVLLATPEPPDGVPKADADIILGPSHEKSEAPPGVSSGVPKVCGRFSMGYAGARFFS